jgi:hypothetical protein
MIKKHINTYLAITLTLLNINMCFSKEYIDGNQVDKIIDGSNIKTGTVDKTKLTEETIEWIETVGPEYIEIEIPLNPGGLPGLWTDFEVKIFQVNNSDTPFAETNMVYYHQTWTNEYVNTIGDSDARVYYIDDHKTWGEGMYMRWTLAVTNSSIYEQRISTNTVIESALLSVSKEGCAIDWMTWQSYTNRHNLRAAYIRYDAIGPEMNLSGTQQRWNIATINWVIKRINEE